MGEINSYKCDDCGEPVEVPVSVCGICWYDAGPFLVWIGGRDLTGRQDAPQLNDPAREQVAA
jgi:hypothetical protein